MPFMPLSGLGSLVSTPWTPKLFIYNRTLLSQAGRRQFEPGVPRHFFSIVYRPRSDETMLSDESQQQIEQIVREQQREPGEVLEEAVRRYATACRLQRFADKMGQWAR